MPTRKGEIELTVERPLGPEPGAGVVRLTVHVEGRADGTSPEMSELRQTLDRLRTDLDALTGVPLAGAPGVREDRGLTELINTYRPRQRELVDLLRDEGELSIGEHALLVTYLSDGASAFQPASAPSAPTPPVPVAVRPSLGDQPIAAAPLANDRAPERARPVAELLRTFQIENLRQAGAVRARRQISFEEYMALKRHFESTPGGENVASGGEGAAR